MDQMTEYNERFMDREGPTDVLAFPLEDLEPGNAPRRLAGEPPLSLGDVFLCPAEIEAPRRRRGLRLSTTSSTSSLVHGILHLLGYDHEDDERADAMEQREEELLALIGRSVK